MTLQKYHRQLYCCLNLNRGLFKALLHSIELFMKDSCPASSTVLWRELLFLHCLWTHYVHCTVYTVST